MLTGVDVAGRRVFREYLRLEYSEENMLFWLAVEELKNEQDERRVMEQVRVIYEDFISILSPREVRQHRIHETAKIIMRPLRQDKLDNSHCLPSSCLVPHKTSMQHRRLVLFFAVSACFQTTSLLKSGSQRRVW